MKIIALLATVSFLSACASAPPASTASSPALLPIAASTGTAPSGDGAISKGLVDASAVRALQSMGTYLQNLRRYEVSLDLTGERVLEDGQKLMNSATADLQVSSPYKIRAATTTATARRVLTYDGKRVVLQFPDGNYYSTVPFSGTVVELIDKLRTAYGIEFPAADLFAWGTTAAPYNDIQSAMNAGQAIVDGTLCDHYAFRQPSIDWQIWLRTEGDPLPMKLVITSLDDEARPQSTTIFHWNLRPAFKDSSFTFAPPSGAKIIDMVPIKNAQR